MRDEDQPKYLNSPETPIYRKTSVLYNLHRARDGMRKAGSRGAGGRLHGRDRRLFGGSQGSGGQLRHCADAHQVRAIQRHADTIVVNFDPDTAGANAAEKALQLLLDEGLHVRVLDSGRRAGSGRICETERRGSLSGQAGFGQRIFSLAGGPRAREVRYAHRGRARWTRSSFCCRRCRSFGDKLERAAVAEDLAPTWEWSGAWCWISSRRRATERQARGAPARSPARRFRRSSVFCSGRYWAATGRARRCCRSSAADDRGGSNRRRFSRRFGKL